MSEKASIYTLAEELGVSPSTVSRALNNSPKLSDKRRQQVLQLARQKGFKLRGFAPRMTNLCLLICSHSEGEDLFNSFTDEVLNGLRQYCVEADLELSIFGSSVSKLNNINVHKEMQRRGVDGAIMVNANEDCRFLQELAKQAFPFCCFMSSPRGFSDRRLQVDHQASVEAACKYLIQLGHRRIAFILSDAKNRVHNDRLDAYRRVMAAHGIEVDAAWVPEASQNLDAVEHGYQATLQLLNSAQEITAVISMGYELSLGIAHAVNSLGLQIPKDLSLLSFDDSLHARYFNPPLTVMDVPNRKLGFLAGRWTHQWIQNGEPEALPLAAGSAGQLMIRQSTAALASR